MKSNSTLSFYPGRPHSHSRTCCNTSYVQQSLLAILSQNWVKLRVTIKTNRDILNLLYTGSSQFLWRLLGPCHKCYGIRHGVIIRANHTQTLA